MTGGTNGKTLYLFGDQTFDLQPHLRNLYSQVQHYDGEGHNLLVTFLNKAYEVLQTEQCGINSLSEMMNWPSKSEQKAGGQDLRVEMALAVVLQLGSYIQLSSSIQQEHEHVMKPEDNIRTLGFCTGSLAAAVVGCSQSDLDAVVKLGAQAIRTAYRVGGVVGAVTSSASSGTREGAVEDSHALALLGPNAEALFERYLADSETALNESKPYIIAYPPRGITVSAPPHILQKVEKWSGFEEAGLEVRHLPVFGLYHAKHLYSSDDIRRLVVAGLADESGGGRISKADVTVISGAGDFAQTGSSFEHLIERAVRQILHEPLRWRSVIEVVKTWI